MTYEIRIIKREKNTTFDADLESFNEKYPLRRDMYDNGRYEQERRLNPEYPQQERITDALMTELTDEQYKKVKAEIIKSFE